MARASLVSLLLFFAVLCGVARADVFDDNPAAVSLGAGNVWVFARGADGQILSRHLSAGAWNDWAAVPGLDAGSGPGAVAIGATILLFARGQDGALWQNTLQNGSWIGWVSLGGGLTSAPSAGLRFNSTTVDVVVKGLDNTLFRRTLVPGQGWAGWEATPSGNVNSAPTVIGYYSSGTIDVFFTAASLQLGQLYADASGWHNGGPYGGALRGAPAAVSPQLNWLDIFARGIDDGLYYHQHLPVQTAGWKLIDRTALASAPAGTSDAPSRELLFARIGGGLSMMTVTNAATATPTYGAWQPLGPVAVPAPPPVVTPTVAPPAIAPIILVTLSPLLSYNFKSVTRKSTRFASLSIKNVPKGATVKVSCSRGCTAKSLTKTNAPRTVSLSKFIRRAWKVGTTLTVIVSKPGTIASVKTLKIRAKKPPLLTSRCMPPGAAKPTACSAG